MASKQSSFIDDLDGLAKQVFAVLAIHANTTKHDTDYQYSISISELKESLNPDNVSLKDILSTIKLLIASKVEWTTYADSKAKTVVSSYISDAYITNNSTQGDGRIVYSIPALLRNELSTNNNIEIIKDYLQKLT